VVAALVHARKLGHVPTTAFALYHRTLLHGVLATDATALVAGGRELAQLGREHRFEMWQVCGELLRGLGEAQAAGTDATLRAAERQLVDFEDMGVVYRPLYSTFLARICLASGNVERGAEHLDTTFALVERSAERWSTSLTWRTAGELALTGSDPDPERAGRCFDAAVKAAIDAGAVRWLDEARHCRDALRGAEPSTVAGPPPPPG